MPPLLPLRLSPLASRLPPPVSRLPPPGSAATEREMSGAKYQSLIESSSIQGGNAAYVEDLYEQYLGDPDSVDPE